MKRKRTDGEMMSDILKALPHDFILCFGRDANCEEVESDVGLAIHRLKIAPKEIKAQ